MMFRLKSFEAGIALPIALIFLAIMMLIAVTAIHSVTLGEKITANARNQQLAFQAAETGLRFCETGAQMNHIVPIKGAAARPLDQMLTPAVDHANVWDIWPQAASTTVTLDQASTNQMKVQCLIEDVTASVALSPTQTKRDLTDKVYRITALANDPKTKVMLQSYLKF